MMEFGTVGPNESPNDEATPTAREKRKEDSERKTKEKKGLDPAEKEKEKEKKARKKEGAWVSCPKAAAATSVETARETQ